MICSGARSRSGLREKCQTRNRLEVDDVAGPDHGAHLLDAKRARLDVLILVLFRFLVLRARFTQSARPIEVHFLVAVARRRKECTEPIELLRNQSDFLLAFTGGSLLRILVGLERAGRKLPRPTSDGVAVLPDENDVAVLRHRDEHHGSWVPDDFHVEAAALP